MSIARNILITVSVVAGVALVGLRFAQASADGPLNAVIPGGPLRSGPLVTGPVDDWSFAHGRLIELQIESTGASRYTGVLVHDGELYVPCDLGFMADRVPQGRLMSKAILLVKRWHEDAAKDGRVVFRLDGKRYPRHAERVIDPRRLAELREVVEGLGNQYFDQPLLDRPADPDAIWFFHLAAPPSAPGTPGEPVTTAQEDRWRPLCDPTSADAEQICAA